jgi:hypothetical protein
MLTILWSDVCEGDVRRMPWPVAARICAAVIGYAEGGTGLIERTTPGDPSQLRVRVRGAAALVRLDAETRTLFVSRIHATK